MGGLSWRRVWVGSMVVAQYLWRWQSQVRGRRLRNGGWKRKRVILYRTGCEGKVLSCEEVQCWREGSEVDGISYVEGFKIWQISYVESFKT